MVNLPDDIELMRRLAEHDQAALAELHRRYVNLVFSLSLRILRDNSTAEEVVQDTFLKLWRSPAAWDHTKGRLSSWLLTIARRTAIDRLRHDRLRPVTAAELSAESLPAESPPPEQALWEEGALIRVLLDRLAEEHRSLIEMAFYHGLTHSEIAELTQIPLGTVKSRLRAAMQRLRRLWDEAQSQSQHETPQSSSEIQKSNDIL